MNATRTLSAAAAPIRKQDMSLLDIFRIATRMLRTNLLRSLLTVLGVSIAITFMVLLIGFGYGVQSLTIGSIINSKTLLSLNVTATGKNTPLSNKDVEILKAFPAQTGISPVIATSAQLSLDGALAQVSIESGNASYLAMAGVDIPSGHPFKDATREVVLAPQTLELMTLSASDAIGKIVSLTYTDPNNGNAQKQLDNLIVVGVSSPSAGPTVYLPIDLFGSDDRIQFSSIEITGKDRAAILGLRQVIAAKGYTVESQLETLDQAKSVFNYTTLGLAAIGTIALIIASIGMFNTLTIALIERTREIGIMKAIGVTNAAVRRLFLAEAAIIGFLGGLVGIGFGVAIGAFVEAVLNAYALSYQANAVSLFQYPPFFLLGIVIFPILLAMMTGLYPAIRASRLNPLQALRYE